MEFDSEIRLETLPRVSFVCNQSVCADNRANAVDRLLILYVQMANKMHRDSNTIVHLVLLQNSLTSFILDNTALSYQKVHC